MSLIRYSLVRNFVITGSKLLETSFVSVVVITWLLIIVWILLNGGHISTTDSRQSTLNLKIKESIFTNFTENDFDTNYVKPEEFQYYNRIWDSEDISFVFPEEIQIITNLIITANQTQITCPESPLIAGGLCEPNKNHCKDGRQMTHGIETGRCVPGDFRYYNKLNQWLYGNCCEVKGWCNVERLWPPLKGFAPILKQTQESSLWLKNTIEFTEHNIVFDNQPNEKISYYLNCKYDPKTDPMCPVFKLKDILKYSENNNQSYPLMARYGAIINTKIEWYCFLPFTRDFDSAKDCQIKYSFKRIDNEKREPTTGYTSFRQIFYSGNSRTHWRTYRLRILVDVKAYLSRYDFFKFVSLVIGYNGIFSLVLWLFSKHVKTLLISRGHPIDETIDINKPLMADEVPNEEVRNLNQGELDICETSILIENEIVDNDNEESIYESTRERPVIELRPPFDQSSD